MGLMIDDSLDSVEREFKGITFIIGSANDHDYRNKISDLVRREHRMGKKDLSAEDDDLIFSKAAYKTVLRGWKNFKLNGVDVPFTYENCVDVLTSNPNARKFIFVIANEAAEFDREWNEKILGESGTTSTGT